MKPYAKANVHHGFSQEEIAEAVGNALLTLWGYEERSPGTYEAAIGGAALTTGGERFSVDIAEEGLIKIYSESNPPNRLWPGAVYDNKNRQNVKDFLLALKLSLVASGLAKSKPEAYSLLLSTGRSDTDIASRAYTPIGFVKSTESSGADLANRAGTGRASGCSLLAISMIIIPAGIGAFVCAVAILSLIFS